MNIFAARVALLVVLLGFAGSRAQEGEDLENLIWTADGAAAAVTLILDHTRGFDPAFKSAYSTPLDRETTEIVIYSTPLKDSQQISL